MTKKSLEAFRKLAFKRLYALVDAPMSAETKKERSLLTALLKALRAIEPYCG